MAAPRNVVGLAPQGSGSTGRQVVGLAPAGKDAGGRLVVGLGPRAGRGGPVSKNSGGGGGLLGGLGHFFKQTGADLVNVAENAPAGLAKIGEAGYQQVVHGEGSPFHRKGDAKTPLTDLAVGSAKQVKTDLSHPLRHPGYTLLDLLPAGEGAGRLAEAGSLAKKGAGAGDVAKALAGRAKPGVRELDVNGLKVRGHYSRAAGSRAVQKATDTLLQKGAKRGTGLTVAGKELSAEKLLHGRAAKWLARNERVADSVARAPGIRVRALGAKLKPDELRAIRLVAEEAPVERRLAAQTLRKGAAKTAKEAASHQERIDLTKQAMRYLDEGPDGRPVFKPDATKLRKVYDAVKAASKDREHMLENVGLLDKEAAQAAKTKVGKAAVGEAKLATTKPFEASLEAVHIGNPVERTKVGGQPRISSTGTFGHTRKPGSLKEATGGSIEHALERNDVTNLVAERHAEAVRLSKIDRARKTLARAGTPTPGRRNDVFVWTDKLTKNERIPREVRGFLDNPDSIAKQPVDAQESIFHAVKDAVFHRGDWVDPQARAEFEKLAKEGKGVFVPRRLAGEYAKRDYSLGHVPGVGVIDTVNNAQKAALVYLKLNYPLIQGLSNTTMNLIQQGFASVPNLTRAARLDSRLGPEYAGVVDDIMGQGAVLQARLEGQSRTAHVTSKIAEVMSHKVDTPARRAAFLYEAQRAGFKTPAQIRSLVEDDKNAAALAEVAQRAKEAIVDFGEQGPFERSVVKRLVFVYPWQKGATKYAGHFLRDHPVQAAALSQAGVIGKNESDQKLGPVPSYLNGVFDVGGGLVNPAGVNQFQTPAQILQAVSGTLSGDPTQRGALQNFLAPAPATLVGLLTGANDIGIPLKGNLPSKVWQLTGAQAPAVQAIEAATGHGRHSKTFPNPHDPLFRLLLGGLYPRQYSKGVLNQNAAREKTGR